MKAISMEAGPARTSETHIPRFQQCLHETHCVRIAGLNRFLPMARPVQFSVLLLLFLWGSFAYFDHRVPGWNVNSRLSLTYALLDKGSVRIDDYRAAPETSTDDVAEYRGHFYSDKIIGTSLCGLPAYACVKLIEATRGEKLNPDLKRYLVTTFSVGLLAAASGVMLFFLLLRWQARWNLSASFAGPLLVTLLIFFGTQIFFYSTLFMSYLPAQFFFIWALLVIEKNRDRGSACPYFAIGLLLGLSMLCEYTSGILAVLTGVYAAFVFSDFRRLWQYAAGAIAGLLPFILYSYFIFGHFAIPYQYEHNDLFKTYMRTGFLGAHWPRLSVLVLITFHPYRGLFVHSPFLLAAMAGLVAMLIHPRTRAIAVLSAAATACYLLFNSAYYMWWGGFSFGPRHLIPMLPLLAIPVLWIWQFRPWRVVICILGVLSIGIHLIVNSIEPQIPDRLGMIPLESLLHPALSNSYPWAFTHYLWPAFWMGMMSEATRTPGTIAGIPPGPMRLLPLLAWWVAGITILFIAGNRRRADVPKTQA
jgi:hypothetical protein